LLAAHAAIAIENARLYEEAKRSKASFLESESKFRTLADTASIAIFIHQGGKFLYTNHAAEIIGGYTVDEYLAMDFLSLAHPDYLDTIKARARERLGSGQPPIQYEFKIVRKDGKERWVLMTAGITEYEGDPRSSERLLILLRANRLKKRRNVFLGSLKKPPVPSRRARLSSVHWQRRRRPGSSSIGEKSSSMPTPPGNILPAISRMNFFL
jgi:PAS domain S-box-containing protein